MNLRVDSSMSDISVLSIMIVALVVTLVRIRWLIWWVSVHEHLRRHSKVLTLWHVVHMGWLHTHIHVRWHWSGIALHRCLSLWHHLRGSDVWHELIWGRWSTLVWHESILWWHTVSMHSSIYWVLISIWRHLISSMTLGMYVMGHRHWWFWLHWALLQISSSLILIVDLCNDFFQKSF